MNRKIHVRFWSRATGATPSLRLTQSGKGEQAKEETQRRNEEREAEGGGAGSTNIAAGPTCKLISL